MITIFGGPFPCANTGAVKQQVQRASPILPMLKRRSHSGVRTVFMGPKDEYGNSDSSGSRIFVKCENFAGLGSGHGVPFGWQLLPVIPGLLLILEVPQNRRTQTLGMIWDIRLPKSDLSRES